MARITLDLLRKRCEHNDGLIHNLEELSLHQDNLEEIENIDKWCKDLKILYLQGNSILKIENLNRLKNLEYLNLALNGIERIENLEGCEALRKLDLTANFVGDLTSVENLRANPYLDELFLTGNPCVEFEGYRAYVIAALPHLRLLDGQEVTRTEQLQALHSFLETKAKIIKQQVAHKAQREVERADNSTKLINAKGAQGDGEGWEKLSWSPEYRREMNRHRADQNQDKSHKNLLNSKKAKRNVAMYSRTGQIMNINEARLAYSLVEEDTQLVLDVSVYRHLDISLINVDVHPFHVKVTVKEKILQLKLDHEVSPDKSTIKRSRTSGHLVIYMPLADDSLKTTSKKLRAVPSQVRSLTITQNSAVTPSSAANRTEKLEVDPSLRSRILLDFAKTERNKKKIQKTAKNWKSCESGATVAGGFHQDTPLVRPNSPNFIDDLSVPPLV